MTMSLTKSRIASRLRTRRRFCYTLAANVVGAPLVLSQTTSPAGSIRAVGGTAIFTVDYVRPLESVVYTFVQEYGWPITFEEAPLLYSGDIVDVTRNFTLGRRALDPRGGRLEFSYQIGVDDAPPNDPAPVLRAAIEAYHRGGFPGQYELLSAEGYFHIVPTARANATGTPEPIQSPFDAVITIDGAGRPPELVVKELVQSVRSISGYQVVIGRTPFLPGEQPPIDQRFENAGARAVLRSIIRATGRLRIWYLMYDIGGRRYYFSIV
jgi:hypothetical protein